MPPPTPGTTTPGADRQGSLTARRPRSQGRSGLTWRAGDAIDAGSPDGQSVPHQGKRSTKVFGFNGSTPRDDEASRAASLAWM